MSSQDDEHRARLEQLAGDYARQFTVRELEIEARAVNNRIHRLQFQRHAIRCAIRMRKAELVQSSGRAYRDNTRIG